MKTVALGWFIPFARLAALPNAPGGIVFVMDALRSMTEALFDPSVDLAAVVGSAAVPATF